MTTAVAFRAFHVSVLSSSRNIYICGPPVPALRFSSTKRTTHTTTAGRSAPGKRTPPSAPSSTPSLTGGVVDIGPRRLQCSSSVLAMPAVDETVGDELDVFRGLVLDTAYRPIIVVCWKRALCLSILEKADVLQYYDHVINSPNQTWSLPAVLRVSSFLHSSKNYKRKLGLSRNNIFLRDKFKCQYCGCRDNLTIDHVKALSKGGGASWENLVTACSPCNLKKGDKSLFESGMRLKKQPKEPKELESQFLPPNFKTFCSLRRHTRTPPEWVDWLPLKTYQQRGM